MTTPNDELIAELQAESAQHKIEGWPETADLLDRAIAALSQDAAIQPVQTCNVEDSPEHKLGVEAGKASQQALQDLATQAQELDMGYGKPAQDAAIQQEPPKFPTMLRKMWSGGEVQDWIDRNWPSPLTRNQVDEAIREASAYVTKQQNEFQEKLNAHPQPATEPVCRPDLTECPRCKNQIGKCDGMFAVTKGKVIKPATQPQPDKAEFVLVPREPTPVTDFQYMCPNCETMWKCKGPHLSGKEST